MNKPTFQQLVGVQWPIAIMAMNRVSDVKLAVAAANAGILPSLSIFNYYIAPSKVSLQKAKDALDSFAQQTNNAPLLLSVSVDTLVDDDSFQLLMDSKLKVIELVLDSPHENQISAERDALRNQRISELSANGTFILQKALNVHDMEDIGLHGFILKGPDGAGRVMQDETSLLDRIRKCRSMYPGAIIIANGGIGNSLQIKECLEAGADAVGLGTIFAAAEECSISLETKLKMVDATADDVKKLSGGAKQHALIFKEVDNDVYNNTFGLSTGIKDPSRGHVFAGAGIGDITAIKSVAEIVQELTTELK